MKRSVIAVSIALWLATSAPAFAWQAQGQQQGQEQGQQQGQGQGQVQKSGDIINAPNSPAPEIPNPAPPVFAPNLVATPETCLGSISGGLTASPGPFSFGLSFGKTYVDPDCTIRMYARAVQVLGDVDVARALLAQNDKVAQAYAAVGRPVKVAAAESVKSAAPAAASVAVQEGVQKDKRAPAPLPAGIVALGPACGDGRPSVIRAGSSIYSCYGWDREGLAKP